VFTRLLVGIDGSPAGDAGLEQGVVLGRQFRSTIVVAHIVPDGGGRTDVSRLLDAARERVWAGSLTAEVIETSGAPDLELARLAQGVDAVLVGRRGSSTPSPALGPTAVSLIRIARCCVIVCGGTASAMRSCAIAFDGGETSMRALELAARFASVAGTVLHIIHAAADRMRALQVVGVAEATLSLQRVEFVTHIDSGRPGEVIARVLKETRCDGLFAGAHAARRGGPADSHVEEILRHTEIPVLVQP